MLLFLLCMIAFLAGFTDAVVGGGGLIQLPVMFIAFPNWLPINVFATNRFSSACGTLMASIQYARKISINWKIVFITSAASMLAAFVGAKTMQLISPDVFKPIVLIVLIVVAVYTYSKKEFGVIGNDEHVNTLHFLYPAVIGLAIGFYNGFIGPGTGSF